MDKKQKKCMICGKVSNESICDSCKVRVQGEAADKKIKVEKSVRVGQQVEADRTAKNKNKS